MTVESHRATLEQKHAALQSKIHEEELRPSPDQTRLHSLKKEKLRIKEELTGLNS